MTLHTLKIEKQYFEAICNKEKLFELRKNDRNYKVGDLINFIIKPQASGSKPCETNKLFMITYVLENVPEYGLDKNYCILGIREVVLYDK